MKQITVRDKQNNPYVLTFTAETVKALEARGFNLDAVTEQPMTMIPLTSTMYGQSRKTPSPKR
mgnify:CR=1 FL=1